MGAVSAEAPSLEVLAAELERLRRRVAELERATGLYATNKELDSPGGDPVVRFAPSAWRGPSMLEKHYSECHPGFLDLLASTLTFMAENPKPGKEQYAKGNRLDAKRARSWARRIRARHGESGAGEAEGATPARPRGGRPPARRPGAARAAAAPTAPSTSTETPEEDDWLASPVRTEPNEGTP